MHSPSPELRSWLDQIYATLESAGADAGTVRQSAESHLSASPLLAVVGPFDSGKSSLIKRLCVDDDVRVPETLVISGEPSTQGTSDVQVGRWILRDTPGLDSENEEHAGVAVRTALRADRVLLLLLPNLFAEDSETADLLRSIDAGSVDVVLSRADKPVMTPDADSVGEWAMAKANEVRALGARLGHPNLRVLAVAADPRGRVGNRTADRARFDGTRAWDGVAEIRALLDEPCPPALREAAVVRNVRMALSEVSASLEEPRQAAHASLKAERQAAVLADERLENVRVLRASARTELKERLVHAASTGEAAGARSRVLIAADGWLDHWSDRVERAARDWQLDATGWKGDLSVIADIAVAGTDAPADGEPDLNTKHLEKVLKEQLTGVSGDAARVAEIEAQLKAWETAKRAGKTRDFYADTKTGFGSVREVREAKKELQRQRGRQAAVAVGRVVLDALNEERNLIKQAADQARAEQVRREASEALAVVIARVLFDGGDDGGGFDTMFDELAEQLDEAKETLEIGAAEDQAELERLGAIQDQLLGLRDGPTGVKADIDD